MVLQNIIMSILGFLITFLWALHYIYNDNSGRLPNKPINILWLFIRTAVLFTGIYFLCDISNIYILALYGIFMILMLFLFIHHPIGVISLAFFYVLSQWILGFPVRKELVLQPENIKTRKNDSISDLIGTKAVVTTTLRPAGTVRINDEIYQASSDSGFVDKDTEVTVIEKKGFVLVVRPVNKHNT